MDLISLYVPLRCFAPTFSLRMLMLMLFLGRNTEGVLVIGGNLTAVQGDGVVLPCKMTELKESLTQISWRRRTRGWPENNFFYIISVKSGPISVNGPDPRITFVGNFAERNGSLQISKVSLKDEGSYSCIFTLFPSGTYGTEIPLQLKVPPSTSLSYDPLILGDEEVLLANCTAAGSRPAAQVRWITGALERDLRETTSSTEHANGTTTTVSSLFGVPTREVSGHEVQCVVSGSALSEDHHETFTIEVFFPPMNVAVVERSGNTLECVSEGNPKPSFNWTRSNNKILPNSDIRVDGANLTILQWASHLTGLYQCEVWNPYGRQNQQIYLAVGSESNPAPWVLFGILLLLNVMVTVWYLYKTGSFARIFTKNETYSVARRGPSDSNSPEMEPTNDRGRNNSGSHEMVPQ